MDSPDTVSEALDLLAERGYVDAFEICADGVRSSGSGDAHPESDVVVDYTFRFEGDSDPADEAIVLGVRCSGDAKGVVVSAYGPDIDPAHARLLAALSSRD